MSDLLPLYLDRSGERSHQTDEVTEKHTLTPAALAKQDKGFPLGNIKINTLQDFLSADRLAKITNLDKIVFGGIHQ
jgi:hypothetical protein